jgi:glycosyltransferase involved in cell wall biosynthesis
LLEDGGDGLLVPPGDPERLAEALVALASDGAFRRRLAAQAFSARRRFDSLTVARRAAAALRTAAAGVVLETSARQPLSDPS